MRDSNGLTAADWGVGKRAKRETADLMARAKVECYRDVLLLIERARTLTVEVEGKRTAIPAGSDDKLSWLYQNVDARMERELSRHGKGRARVKGGAV